MCLYSHQWLVNSLGVRQIKYGPFSKIPREFNQKYPNHIETIRLLLVSMRFLALLVRFYWSFSLNKGLLTRKIRVDRKFALICPLLKHKTINRQKKNFYLNREIFFFKIEILLALIKAKYYEPVNIHPIG